jgi:hypothetical protein
VRAGHPLPGLSVGGADGVAGAVGVVSGAAVLDAAA